MGWSWPEHKPGWGQELQFSRREMKEYAPSHWDPTHSSQIFQLWMPSGPQSHRDWAGIYVTSVAFATWTCAEPRTLSCCKSSSKNQNETLGNGNFLILNCQEECQSVVWFWSFLVMLGYDEPPISIETIYDYDAELPHRIPELYGKQTSSFSHRTLSSESKCSTGAEELPWLHILSASHWLTSDWVCQSSIFGLQHNLAVKKKKPERWMTTTENCFLSLSTNDVLDPLM